MAEMNLHENSSGLAGAPSTLSISLESPRERPPVMYSRRKRMNPKIYESSMSGLEMAVIDGDDDDERKEKKIKLIDQLIQVGENIEGDEKRQHSRNNDSLPCSDSASRKVVHAKKHKINATSHRSNDAMWTRKEKEAVKETETSTTGLELTLKSGPTTMTPLPDKKLLAAILDKLQNKDALKAFAEPVGNDDLPDCNKIIEQPMDFTTVRKKLEDGAYMYFEDLEADVLFMCSNAMMYNAPRTALYRQAQTIQRLVKKEFNNLKHGEENDTQPPKVARRGRPPKSQKKLTTEPPMQPSANVVSLPSEEEKVTESSPYNLRKGPRKGLVVSRHRSSDLLVPPHNARCGKKNPESSSVYKWNDEFPTSVVRADMKQGQRKLTVDISRRDTYSQPPPPTSTNMANSLENAEQLAPGGLEDPVAYARSLARFAADLGPVAWEVASKRIASVLPPGTPFGPGWTGQIADSTQSLIPLVDLTAAGTAVRPPSGGLAEPIRRLSSHREVAARDEGYAREMAFPRQPPLHPYQNYPESSSFGGIFGYSDASATGNTRRAMPGLQGLPPLPPQITQNMYPNVLPSVHLSATNHAAMPEQARVHVDSSSSSATHQTAQARQFVNAQVEGRTRSLKGTSWHTMLMQQQQQWRYLGGWRSSSNADKGGSSSQR